MLGGERVNSLHIINAPVAIGKRINQTGINSPVGGVEAGFYAQTLDITLFRGIGCSATIAIGAIKAVATVSGSSG